MRIAKEEFYSNYGFLGIFQRFLGVRATSLHQPIFDKTPSKIKQPQFDGYPNYPLLGQNNTYLID